jgi:hypothetical protein
LRIEQHHGGFLGCLGLPIDAARLRRAVPATGEEDGQYEPASNAGSEKSAGACRHGWGMIAKPEAFEGAVANPDSFMTRANVRPQ